MAGHDCLRPIENSLDAYESAWTAGVAYCECDVALTLDEYIVLAHDASLERLALDSQAAAFVRQPRLTSAYHGELGTAGRQLVRLHRRPHFPRPHVATAPRWQPTTAAHRGANFVANFGNPRRVYANLQRTFLSI